MKISDMKQKLAQVKTVNFKMPDGSYLPSHFHVTEVGLVTKHFIDCGGVERKETVPNFQLWEAGDYDHRLAPQKFLHILNLSKKVQGMKIYLSRWSISKTLSASLGLSSMGKISF